jgi:hypothetical protein
VALQPGFGDADDQAKLNRLIMASVEKACAKHGVRLLADYYDGHPRESMYIRKKLVKYVRLLAADALGASSANFAGLDMPHVRKSQRNAVCFGGTCSPSGA